MVPARNKAEDAVSRVRQWEGWTNCPSAVEEGVELRRLVEDYKSRGFCHFVYSQHFVHSQHEARKELSETPLFNKLGVIVKMKARTGDEEVRQTRIIWDLRESGANDSCFQSERVVLPRTLSRLFFKNLPFKREPGLRDAFMNVPGRPGRVYIAAAVPWATQVLTLCGKALRCWPPSACGFLL